MSFSGSYREGEVEFLLTPLPLQDFVDVADKEYLIQSGQRHYSEMLSPEVLPSQRYLDVFRQACAANNDRMARDCLTLAALIAARRDGAITVVSLARAGTPVGVVLTRLLNGVLERQAHHYSVSIIRDRGIDSNALAYILAQGHAAASLVFVDGWTGKGVIAAELRSTIATFNASHGTAIDGGLYVLSDLAGTAACAASCDDYLIPSSILNATVSGLVSRSILNASIGPGQFHGCVVYQQFAAHDQSQAFADAIVAAAEAQLSAGEGMQAAPSDQARAAAVSRAYMQAALRQHGIDDVNLVKPGIGEATRVLLRRTPRLLIVRDGGARDVAHLLLLAQEKQVPMLVDGALPYHAVSLIRSALDA
ncbi:cysteine protease StiP family protein [Massilia sp. PWRC2]|uniref:cysteine protease StiP family protein n=1 Tax=Massilia sp. PWRC2 TaxID=2804626 RepID=UPI003CF43C73